MPEPTGAPAAPRSPPASVAIDLAEEAGSRFDEMCDHVAARREFTELHLEPVRPLPMMERQAGTFVWSRHATVGGGTGRRAGSGGGGFTLFYAVVPGIEAEEAPQEGETPVLGLPWATVTVAELVRGEPRAWLLLRADGARYAAVARSFTERVRAELESEPD